MKRQLKKEGLRTTDEAWLVVDQDQWTEQQLEQLFAWSKEQENYHLALSNPCFELWLLLHFEDAKNISSTTKWADKLENISPNLTKKLLPPTVQS